ncbi:MASE3 domain-containing protein [Neobacillus notoginsengisoli]|uniref:MASE3 domain-containing protein n=1 Tax=Neobacillus notoginsengisoli TaxID=1578198 RepID=UPI001313F554|nr:MASE3 domain-containing protein [Neobacillus notoginsengisoli]
MEDRMTEWRFLVYVMGAVMALLGIHVFHPQLVKIYDPVNYVSFHALLELSSISISFLIVLYCWRKLEQNKSAKLLILLFAFFTVGMVDLLHTLSFKGMPHFLTESSVAKATCFWVFARMVEAALILTVLVMPEIRVRKDWRKHVLAASFLLVIVIAAVVFTFENSLPVLVVEGQGTTSLKNGLEYFISFLHFLSLIVCLYRYYLEKSTTYLNLALAFTYLFLSEMIFTVYQSVVDLDNFSGHIFKVLGYYFILKGLYLLLKPEKKSSAESIMKQSPGAVFSFAKMDGRFIFSYIDGGLLGEMGLKPCQMAGTQVEDLLPPAAGAVIDHCNDSWESGDKHTFTAFLKGRHLIISLAPIIKEGIVIEIAGTATDISTFIQSAATPAKTRPMAGEAQEERMLQTL